MYAAVKAKMGSAGAWGTCSNMDFFLTMPSAKDADWAAAGKDGWVKWEVRASMRVRPTPEAISMVLFNNGPNER